MGRIGSTCTIHHGCQDCCTTREKILCLDWRIYSCFSFHFRGNVGPKGRIRRIWPKHCSPKVHINGNEKKKGKRTFLWETKTEIKEDDRAFRITSVSERLHFLLGLVQFKAMMGTVYMTNGGLFLYV